MIQLTWDVFLDDIFKLADKLKNNINFNKCAGVYGKPRSGLIVAQILSYQLNLPYLYYPPFLSVNDEKNWFLVVDDFVNTGTGFFTILDQYKSEMIKTAAVYKRYTSKFEPTLHHKTIYSEDWVIFPYEKKSVDEKEEKDKHQEKVNNSK